MSMTEWAEREVKIACAREGKHSTEDGEWDYGCACYESALKAFKSLTGDGHSGFSIGITKRILNRLIDGRPLTPIEDTDDIWNDVSYRDDNYQEFQCQRMSSLFKRVYPDGTVKYRDIDGHYCINIHNPNDAYHSGLVQKIVDEMFPVTMPYFPGDPIKVYCEDLLTDWKNGDFDTIGVFYAKKPDGFVIPINRYFKESGKDWEEITVTEYKDRERMSVEKCRVDD